jgi:hypothetical protein
MRGSRGSARVIRDPGTWTTPGTAAYRLRHGAGRVKTNVPPSRGSSESPDVRTSRAQLDLVRAGVAVGRSMAPRARHHHRDAAARDSDVRAFRMSPTRRERILFRSSARERGGATDHGILARAIQRKRKKTDKS